jgi:RNA polymerase sigma-70 factor (ECF subfamily)
MLDSSGADSLNTTGASPIQATIEAVYQTESRRVLATLIRLLGDFDLAEEALQDAFAAALAQWPRSGVPANPRAWLVSAGRFKAIDGLRRGKRFDAALPVLAEQQDRGGDDPAGWDQSGVADDQLRLIFTCCHPALAPEARVALTLREVCGLTTEEIARAYLTSPTTLAQRIVRAKAKIRAARIPYRVPAPADLPERLGTVLHVVYLVFNEGYAASAGEALTRTDLSGEAIRLGRLLQELLPEPEVMGLLALMLLHEARRAARATPEGDVVPLEEQDRALWDQGLIAEGRALAARALAGGQPGRYGLQAAIVAVHALAPSAEKTDWERIVALYNALAALDPSPVVALNRAVAVAMRGGGPEGLEAGLALVDEILGRGDLASYHPAHTVRGELCRRLGRTAEARTSYERALALAQQGPERRMIERRLAELGE